MKQPKSEIPDDFENPDELMPIPDRLKQETEEASGVLEAPVRSPEPEIRASKVKPVSGIVEPDSLAVIRARKDARLANLRR